MRSERPVRRYPSFPLPKVVVRTAYPTTLNCSRGRKSTRTRSRGNGNHFSRFNSDFSSAGLEGSRRTRVWFVDGAGSQFITGETVFVAAACLCVKLAKHARPAMSLARDTMVPGQDAFDQK